MIKQELYNDNSNMDGVGDGLYDVILRFKDALSKYNGDGWECGNHTITKDEEGDWLLVAVFSRVEDKT